MVRLRNTDFQKLNQSRISVFPLISTIGIQFNSITTSDLILVVSPLGYYRDPSQVPYCIFSTLLMLALAPSIPYAFAGDIQLVYSVDHESILIADNYLDALNNYSTRRNLTLNINKCSLYIICPKSSEILCKSQLKIGMVYDSNLKIQNYL